jgi:hypothetical protein
VNSESKATHFHYNGKTHIGILVTVTQSVTWFGMVAILNQKWPPKYKNPPIWAKFGFQHDRVKNWALIILKTKSTTLSDDLFLCQVSKGSAVRFEFKKFCTLVTMATVAILNFFNPQKLPHTKSSELGENWFPSRL